MTLKQIAELDRDFLIPSEVAPLLGTSAHAISVTVREDKERGTNRFPFPTMRVGNRTKIPRIPFLEAMGYRTESKEEQTA